MGTNCPPLDDPKLSPLFKKDVVVKEKTNNNTPAHARETGASMISGVVVVVPDEEDADDAAIPTPRTKAYRLLRDYGVTEQAILPLIHAHSDSEIERQVAHLDFEQSQGKRLRNPGGRLAKMIREEWALPPGAEAAYRRRFLGEVAGEAGPPASVPEATPVEPDAFDLRLGALSEEERTTLRQRTKQLAREQNPDMSERLLESQVIYHMRRLLPRPSRVANDSQDAS